MENNHPHIPSKKTGILLINLGTPSSTKTADVRRYLREFLSDPRVIETPKWLWRIILNAFILPFRSKKSAKAYKKIWIHDINESPLRHFTRLQAKKLAERFPNHIVGFAMRYGEPNIESEIKKMMDKGCQRFVVLPLYPQYSATTTASIVDEVNRVLTTLRWQPNIRFVEPFESYPLYIQVIGDSIKKHLSSLDWKPDRLLFSFHGLPQSYFDKGDPYHCFCRKTARLVSEYMNLDDIETTTCFQSRFGPAKWLEPDTEKIIIQLAESGQRNCAVVCPGFFSDCLETLEEINMEARTTFLEHKGSNFTFIDCLNDSKEGIDLLEGLVLDTLSDHWSHSHDTSE